MSRFTDIEFLHNFWMTKRIFAYICEQLSPTLVRQNTNFRHPVPVNKHVGTGLYWLATGTCLLTVANLFGIAKSTVCIILHEFCCEVRQVLLPEYIKMPKGDDLHEVIMGFRQKWGFSYVRRGN
ncbi:protein ANTAGONIST OF LIKE HETEROCHROMATIN PROTEIN 1-like isoform X2 [Xyrichtys novacula]|uniref:Protein ANTAGONIST OF LIKE HETEROCHROMATIN PROTEIN 1-like isoform X2 n=1 Tax=Xyrichtys novacula TaxID=13765 RepID=A0AAV1FUK6_XYRNO|nr:protein ANTAGONIST OF LIKE HETEROCHROMATIN PROTEIN 1-like isoform X2 [Xyrichtys novacula]